MRAIRRFAIAVVAALLLAGCTGTNDNTTDSVKDEVGFENLRIDSEVEVAARPFVYQDKGYCVTPPETAKSFCNDSPFEPLVVSDAPSSSAPEKDKKAWEYFLQHSGDYGNVKFGQKYITGVAAQPAYTARMQALREKYKAQIDKIAGDAWYYTGSGLAVHEDMIAKRVLAGPSRKRFPEGDPWHHARTCVYDGSGKIVPIWMHPTMYPKMAATTTC